MIDDAFSCCLLNLVGTGGSYTRSVREIVTSFKFFFWFDILDKNGLPFLEQTANRLSPESMFAVLDKMAHRY